VKQAASLNRARQ